jgi:hypothetical protein
LTSDEKDELKSKLRRSCENYYHCEQNERKINDVIKKISGNKNVRILKQDKGRGVVILDNSKYIEKCMELLNTGNFNKIQNDDTDKVEKSVQKALSKVKEAIGEQTYKDIYPSGSNPGKFYGTAKVHKVKATDEDKVGKLPVRPIVSNIGTATHKTAKYLSKLLSPLAKSKYTIENTKDFVTRIKKMKVPEGYKMISFDVVSLFTNVPIKETVEIILRKVYKEKLVKTKIKKENMRELLMLCTTEVSFTFNNEMYKQVDGVMMGSPLGPLFANIFMCELENRVIPTLTGKICNWVRYVDDTFGLIKIGEEQHVQQELNKYHPNIQFTQEVEKDEMISFLDVAIKRSGGTIETSVYRKKTNTDVYIHWKAHAPSSWKIATLKNLIQRATRVCSTDQALQQELVHLKKVFCTINDYPEALVEEIIKNEKDRHNQPITNPTECDETKMDEEQEEIQLMLSLPYAGKVGEQIVEKVQKYVKKKASNGNKKVRVNAVFKSMKLSSRFPLKDRTKPEHQHNVVYYVKCPNKKCNCAYCGETKRRMGKRTNEHGSTDPKSHVLIHSKKTKHKRVKGEDFKILRSGFTSQFRRKISESLFIKKHKPDLNVQKDSYRLCLFN